ncbi:MAG TPA: enolase C-terminal domain-like protein [Acidimicrobiales bacterium]|nr:enolase C-terminal domain-like protein [Acidimicrobiales bacterium]
MPVHRLLGGAARTDVEAYASLLVYGLPRVVADNACSIPTADHESMRQLRRAGMRVAAGENTGTLFDFARLFARDAVDVAQPDVTKIGGVTELRKVGASLYPGFTDAVDGRVPVPTDAGLGPESDASVIARYRVA